MACGPLLAAPVTLHDLLVRGIEGHAICRDDPDREALGRRLGEGAKAAERTLSAWALGPNPRSLWMWTAAPLRTRALRALLTGYARSSTAAGGNAF